MKTLIVIAVILVVLSLYFVVNADRSIFVKGSEVLPIGTDVARFILNKTKDFISRTNTGTGIDASYPSITNKIKAGIEKIKVEANMLIPKVLDKTTNLIKNPIENKIIETVCPAK